MRQLPLSIQLDDFATFENFWTEENAQAVSTLKTINSQSGEFVFVWGQSEVGKTHLAQAICHQLTAQQKSAVYLPLDDSRLDAEVLDGMQMMDVVCLDNLEKVLGEAKWERALFNLYNELKNLGNHLIIFAKSPPNSLDIDLQDLRSRLSAMTIFQLNQVADNQKIALMQLRASNRGFELSFEVASYIITRYGRSMNELMKILDKLDHASIVLKRKITIPLVKEILS